MKLLIGSPPLVAWISLCTAFIAVPIDRNEDAAGPTLLEQRSLSHLLDPRAPPDFAGVGVELEYRAMTLKNDNDKAYDANDDLMDQLKGAELLLQNNDVSPAPSILYRLSTHLEISMSQATVLNALRHD